MGILASVIANTRGGKKGGRAFQPSDFMPNYRVSRKPMTDPSEFREFAGFFKTMAQESDSQ